MSLTRVSRPQTAHRAYQRWPGTGLQLFLRCLLVAHALPRMQVPALKECGGAQKSSSGSKEVQICFHLGVVYCSVVCCGRDGRWLPRTSFLSRVGIKSGGKFPSLMLFIEGKDRREGKKSGWIKCLDLVRSMQVGTDNSPLVDSHLAQPSALTTVVSAACLMETTPVNSSPSKLGPGSCRRSSCQLSHATHLQSAWSASASKHGNLHVAS